MIKTFEELRSHILEDKHDMMEHSINELEESTEFSRGRVVGYIWALNNILAELRASLKYGEPEELE